MSKRIDEEYIKLAKEQYQKDGEVEIDDGATVSRGDDPGAYVQAWVWVYEEKEEEVKEDPNYTISDWKYEVANDDTHLGYKEWVEHMREANDGG